MKFSQFSDSEKRWSEVRTALQHIELVLDIDTVEFVWYYLPLINMIIRHDADPGLIYEIAEEYRSSDRLVRRLQGRLYLALIWLIFTSRLAHCFFEKLTLRGPRFYPIIVGGNNRIRIVDSCNSYAIVVAKGQEQAETISRVYRANDFIKRQGLEGVPPIFPLDEVCYLERQIRGIACNRLSAKTCCHQLVQDALQHLKAAQNNEKRTISATCYLRYLRLNAYKWAVTSRDPHAQEKAYDFLALINTLLSHRNDDEINIVPSHGDLNRGNAIVNESTLNIIDWEYFGLRSEDYDHVVFHYDLRHCRSIDYRDLVDSAFGNRLTHKLVFLLEEYMFRLVNYKDDVADDKQLLNRAHTLLRGVLAEL